MVSPTPPLPLSGLTLLNSREASDAQSLSTRLQDLGAEVFEYPLLEFTEPVSWDPFDEAWRGLTPGTWVVFTSATAVKRALERIAGLHGDPARLGQQRLAAVGTRTAAALEQRGYRLSVVPEGPFQAEGLLDALKPHLAPGERIWIPRAESAREHLITELQAWGCEVIVTPVYRTVIPPCDPVKLRDPLMRGGIDWLIFTSSSSVDHFFQVLGEESTARLAARGWPRVACLGAVTAQTAKEHGLPVAAQPKRQDLDSLVSALVTVVLEQSQSAT